MRILFDQGTPVPLRAYLTEHDVTTAYEEGWSTLGNGDLLKMIEREGYDLLVTTDTNLQHQQNLTEFGFAIVVLRSTSWPRIKRSITPVLAAIEASEAGGLVEVEIAE